MKSRDLMAMASLANLLYLRVWAELFAASGHSSFSVKMTPTPSHFAAALVNVLVITFVGWAVLGWLRARSTLVARIGPVLFIVASVVLLNQFRGLFPFVDRNLLLFGAVVAAAGVGSLTVGRVHVFRVAYLLLIVFSPFILVTFGRSLYEIVTYESARLADGPLAGRLPESTVGSPRVVWIVFDEWDYGLSFDDRGSGVSLAEVDRLRDESFFATNAVSVSTETNKAMPSLISGFHVEETLGHGPSELKLRVRGTGEEWLLWSEQSNVFRDAREDGLDTAVVGWGIPYCRVLPKWLSSCSWWADSNQYNSTGRGFGEVAVRQTRSLVETLYRSPFGGSLASHHHARTYDEMLAESVRLAADSRFGLVLLHFPIPHPPYFYNAETDRYDFLAHPVLQTLRSSQAGYLDALSLLDRTVGALRGSMEKAGTWDASTIVLSSDHPFRHRAELDGEEVDARVPFLVKPGSSRGGVRYDNPFSTGLTRHLVGALLSGEISQAEEIAEWVEINGARFTAEAGLSRSP